MKYIFIAGVPGSKWSSVAKNIYYSPDIDRSDYSDDRTYYHDASGQRDLMHLGAYWDPGMEFGKFFDNLSSYSKEECEAEFDRPFNPDAKGIRIIKSHVFANHVDFLKQHWPECAVVLVHRGDDACLGWWVKCGHFDITYPLYHSYYKDLKTMAQIIKQQNNGIVNAALTYPGQTPYDNRELCNLLSISAPSNEYQQVYEYTDTKVVVI